MQLPALWSAEPVPVRTTRRMAGLAFGCLSAVGRARVSRELDEGGVTGHLRRAFAFHELCRDVCHSHAMSIEVTGAVPEGPALLAANLLSYLDAIAVAAILPVACIAKLEVERWPLLGDVGRTHGVLFIDRADPWSGARVLRGAARALAAGLPVLNFPEGTTSNGGGLLPFRRGGFGLATVFGAPVVPVAIRFSTPEAHWTGNAAFLPHYLRTAARPRLGAYLHFGAPLRPAPSEPAEALATRVRARLTAMLEE